MIILQLKREYRFIQGYFGERDTNHKRTSDEKLDRCEEDLRLSLEKRRKKSARRGLVLNLFRFCNVGRSQGLDVGRLFIKYTWERYKPIQISGNFKFDLGYRPESFISRSAHDHEAH